VTSLDDEVDRLYGLGLDEFTAARNELAKRLRSDGDREAADRVKALPKPTLPAWAANRLARERQKELRALLDAADSLRGAQEAALGGKQADVRGAMRAQREALRKLVDAARDELEAAGRPAPDATLERVRSTLEAAALDPEARPLLEAGRLTEEHESAGFGALAGMGFAPPAERDQPAKPSRRRGPAAPAKDELAERRRKKLDEARARAAGLRTKARELERAAKEAEREAAKAVRAAESARAEADDAAAAAAEADDEVKRLRS
jgi:hypothetical protein